MDGFGPTPGQRRMNDTIKRLEHFAQLVEKYQAERRKYAESLLADTAKITHAAPQSARQVARLVAPEDARNTRRQVNFRRMRQDAKRSAASRTDMVDLTDKEMVDLTRSP